MEDKSLFTYKGKTFEDFEGLFNYALDLAKKKQTRDEAKEFFDAYVEFVTEANQISHEEGLKIAKSNFGYFAGYFDRDTEALVNELFEAYHPCFGGPWTIDALRELTQAEIDSDPSRWDYYRAGEFTNCFETKKEAIETAKKAAAFRFPGREITIDDYTY